MAQTQGDQLMNSMLVSANLKAGVEVNRRDEDGHSGGREAASRRIMSRTSSAGL